MRRKFIAPGLALLAIAGRLESSGQEGPKVDQLGIDAIAFNREWGVFFRRLFGCRPNERDPENCQPAARQLDFKSYVKARETAKTLFGFTG